MLTVSLVTLIVFAAAASLLVLVDSWLRGTAAYRSLTFSRSHFAEQQGTVKVVTFSVWTGEHSPSRAAMRRAAPLRAAA